MGLLDFLRPRKASRKTPARTGRGAPVVKVAFRDLTSPPPQPGSRGLYLYHWKPGRPAPRVGDRVRVPSSMGGGHAVVVEVGASRREIAESGPLKTVSWVVAPEEVEQAHQKLRANTDAWLNMARREAGMRTTTRRQRPPKGFPDIPPATGEASASAADDYFRAWSRIAGQARDEEERKRFDSIRFRWRAVRNKGGNVISTS